MSEANDRAYKPDFGDDRVCDCGHPYHRHFDSWEDNAPVGCKYCPCYTFREPGVPAPTEAALDAERGAK